MKNVIRDRDAVLPQPWPNHISGGVSRGNEPAYRLRALLGCKSKGTCVDDDFCQFITLGLVAIVRLTEGA